MIPTETISPAVPRFPLVREQLASWKLMPDKQAWRQRWRQEARRLRQTDAGFRRRMHLGICLLLLGIAAICFAATSYRIPAFIGFTVCMGAALLLGRVNTRLLDDALYRRMMAAGRGDDPI